MNILKYCSINLHTKRIIGGCCPRQKYALYWVLSSYIDDVNKSMQL